MLLTLPCCSGVTCRASPDVNNGPRSEFTTDPPVRIRMYTIWFRMRCGPPAGNCRAARGIVRRIMRGSQAPDPGVEGSININTDRRCGPNRGFSPIGSRFARVVIAISSMLSHARLLVLCLLPRSARNCSKSLCSVNNCSPYLRVLQFYVQKRTRTSVSGRENQK